MKGVLFLAAVAWLACGQVSCAPGATAHKGSHKMNAPDKSGQPAVAATTGKPAIPSVPTIAPPAGGAAATAPAAGGGKELAELTFSPAWVSHMACMVSCAKYLKVPATPAWIYGASGHAFALNIHPVMCPSGPTAWAADLCDVLVANAGLIVEGTAANKGQPDFAARQEQIWRLVRQAIDAGRPCFGWEMSVPEWYVIYGYDGAGNYLYRNFFGPGGKLPYRKLGTTEIGWANVRTVRAGKPADDRKTLRDAAEFALEHGAGKHSREKWHTGLSGYDTWIKGMQDPNVQKHKVFGFGLAYNAQCWAQCRRYANLFLQEAAGRLKGDPALAALLTEAQQHYKTVGANLTAVAEAFPFDVKDEAGMNARAAEPARREKALQSLRAARAAEAEGLKVMAKIAAALGAKGTDANKPAAAAGK
jgi:hypothetical protein